MSQAITITRGDTTTLKVVVYNNGSVFNLTGYTPVLTVKTSKDSTTNVIQVTGSVTDATNGVVTFSLSSSDTSVDCSTYYYDVQVSNSSNTYTVLNSTFTVTGDVNRG